MKVVDKVVQYIEYEYNCTLYQFYVIGDDSTGLVLLAEVRGRWIAQVRQRDIEDDTQSLIAADIISSSGFKGGTVDAINITKALMEANA